MSASDVIRAAITAAGGAISFQEFMRLALYGEDGFYTGPRAGRAGRRGDFLTSPEVGPLFGAVVARYLDAEWTRLGRPDPFTVVDAGAGPGTLARAVLRAGPACGVSLRYVAVDVAAGQRARHPAGVESCAVLPPGPFDGVILANELLDDLPFRLLVFDGAWREAFVAAAATGGFLEVLSAPLAAGLPVLPVLPARPALGARAPVQDEAARWVDTARASVRRGSVVVIDYARPTTADHAGLPWRDWLRTYRDHGRGEHYLAAPGGQDITADLALDQLPAADRITSQAEFLRRWGIAELVEQGRRAWGAAAARPDVAALTMRSRTREAEALLDPAGLGGFSVVEWRVPG